MYFVTNNNIACKLLVIRAFKHKFGEVSNEMFFVLPCTKETYLSFNSPKSFYRPMLYISPCVGVHKIVYVRFWIKCI